MRIGGAAACLYRAVCVHDLTLLLGNAHPHVLLRFSAEQAQSTALKN
jgi:hypothetical protein